MKRVRAVWLLATPLLAAGLALTACGFAALTPNGWWVLAGCAGCTAVFFLADRARAKPVLWACLAGILGLCWYVLTLLDIPLSAVFSGAWNACGDALAFLRAWLAASESAPVEYRADAVRVLLCLAVPACTLACYLLCRFWYTRLALAPVLLAAMLVGGALGYPAGKAGVCAVLGLFFLTLLELCARRDRRDRPQLWVFFAPIVALSVLLAAALPAPASPISWQWAADAANAVTRQVKLWREDLVYALGGYDDAFAVSFTGYTEAGGTQSAGTVTETQDDMLFLQSQYRTRSPLYLRGTVLEAYLGTGWDSPASGSRSQTPEYQLEALEQLYCLGRAGLTASEDEYLFTTTDMNYRYGQLLTRTLFYPQGAYSLTPAVRDTSDAFNAAGPNIRFFGLKREGLTYNVRAFQLNYGSQTLQDLLRGQTGYDGLDARLAPQGSFWRLSAAVDVDAGTFTPELLQTLADRAQSIREACLPLPEDLPQRVRDLAAELTRDCDNDYDRVMAIEAYLSQTYAYTRSPGSPPADADLADWFLFERRAGYCTYFATAAAVLCRCAGVPARYVEGALVDFRTPAQEEGWFLVQSGDAHAWAEAYIEGFGWLTLEASPGYNAAQHTAWAKKAAAAPAETDSQPEEPVSGSDVPSPEPEAQPESEPQPELSWAPVPEAEKPGVVWVPWLLGGLGAVLALAAVLVLAGRIGRLRRYRRADSREKVLLLTYDMLRCLSFTGLRPEPGETLAELAARADCDTLTQALPLFQAVRYGGRTPTQRQVRALVVSRNALRQELLHTLRPARALALRSACYGRLRVLEK